MARPGLPVSDAVGRGDARALPLGSGRRGTLAAGRHFQGTPWAPPGAPRPTPLPRAGLQPRCCLLLTPCAPEPKRSGHGWRRRQRAPFSTSFQPQAPILILDPASQLALEPTAAMLLRDAATTTRAFGLAHALFRGGLLSGARRTARRQQLPPAADSCLGRLCTPPPDGRRAAPRGAFPGASVHRCIRLPGDLETSAFWTPAELSSLSSS